MRSRKAILLGSILALVFSGTGNASVRAAETESSSAYISNETAEAIEEADPDRSTGSGSFRTLFRGRKYGDRRYRHHFRV